VLGPGARTLLAAAVALLLVLAAPAAALAATDPVAPGIPGNGRAWELVTPEDVVPGRVAGITAIARSGDRIVYRSAGTMPGAATGPLFTFNLAARGADGWTTTPLEYPRPQDTTLFGLLFETEGPFAFDPELTASIWLNSLEEEDVGLFATAPGGGYRLLVDTKSGNTQVVGASEDLGRVVFRTTGHLLPLDASRTSGSSIYELEGLSLRLLDESGGALISECGVETGAISADASQVFFTANPGCGPYSRVYLHSGGTTTEISASQCTQADCGPESNAVFLGRSADGSTAFIASSERLTDEDSNDDQDIYRYDVASGQLSLLYDRPAGSTATSVTGGLRSSADGSRAYFLASGQLIPGQGSETGLNLYLADAQGLHLVGSDLLEGTETTTGFLVGTDGRYAFLVSHDQLGDGDSDSSADLYRYDAADGELRRVSGSGAGGNGEFAAALPLGNAVDGRRIFFTTTEPLLPGDRNELEDVYEWTEAGLALVSAGTSGFAAEYRGATAEGRTVVFRTEATLLPRDRDGGEFDFYAARVGGGLPEPPPPSACAGDGCEAALASKPLKQPPRPGRRSGRIELAPIDAAARRQLAATGATTLLVEVPAAGVLRASGKARIGGRAAIVAAGGAKAKGPGPLRLRLRLNAAGRRGLAREGRLQLRLLLRQASRPAARTAFTLRSAP
jgi:hypothetical protein